MMPKKSKNQRQEHFKNIALRKKKSCRRASITLNVAYDEKLLPIKSAEIKDV